MTKKAGLVRIGWMPWCTYHVFGNSDRLGPWKERLFDTRIAAKNFTETLASRFEIVPLYAQAPAKARKK